MENLYTTDCIRTASGLYMNVFNPTPEMICIEDIAHALSHQCRFGGHLPEFYSVAQHSFMCAAILKQSNPTLAFQALMHDASEAYLLDIPSPIKKHLANYKEIEHNLMIEIAKKFNFTWPMSQEVKDADVLMLQFEWDVLMIGDRNQIAPELQLYNPVTAKRLFLEEFYQLTK